MTQRADQPEGAGAVDRRLRRLVGYNMKHAFNTVQGDLTAALAPFNLRMFTFTALVLVNDNPGIRPSKLAETMCVERANLVSIIDEVIRKGWVERHPNPEDRRAHALFVTKSGSELCVQAHDAVCAHDKRMHARLTPAERDLLISLLNRVEA